MTEQELKDRGIDIEAYGGGFIVADYSGKVPSRFDAWYRGVSDAWLEQLDNILMDTQFTENTWRQAQQEKEELRKRLIELLTKIEAANA